MTSKSSCNLNKKIKKEAKFSQLQFAFWKISNQMKQRWTSDIGRKCGRAWRLIQVWSNWSKESIRICKTTSKNQESSRLKSSQDVVISSHSEYLLNSSKTKKCLQCGPMASSERTKWNWLLWIIKYGNGVKTQWLWKLHSIDVHLDEENKIYLMFLKYFVPYWLQFIFAEMVSNLKYRSRGQVYRQRSIRAYCTLVKVL